ncbi:NAD(P)/FAD-dependent oxidoreductase [Solimonas marina]|uniref:FAD-dependent oxidoreductase n=1 Tax=Solimonas marina TaxID=2714601 RepID=A0A969WA50_9GAMM|nr:FAD-dependent oxidoreductase [Solimonas marina]
MRETFDVAIVGGGVIGMACAEALSRDGRHRIGLIERDELGRAASWAGGGMLTPLPPDHIPEAVRDLLAESLALYPQWCARLHAESGIDPEYWDCGARYRKDDGTQVDYPRMAQVRNPRLVKALAGTLRRRRGVTIFERTAARGWVLDGDTVIGVRTDDKEIACRQAVLAAGAWSAPLGADGVGPAKGQMLLLGPGEPVLTRLLIGEDVYLIPRRDGQILVGSTLEDAGFDTTPTAAARQSLLARAAQLWPAVHARRVVAHWAGLRPRPAGEGPLLGPHPRLSGLLLATGHFRIGLTLAPGTAARVAHALSPENAVQI